MFKISKKFQRNIFLKRDRNCEKYLEIGKVLQQICEKGTYRK